MKTKRRRGISKRVALAMIAAVSGAAVCAFAAIWLKFSRGDDYNNEQTVLEAAEEARRADNPPLEAQLRMRLVKLNPQRKEYVKEYCRALVRMRDFTALEPYADQFSAERDLTEEEREIERLLANGWAETLRGNHAAAQAHFEKATNLNYYAATPQLADSLVRQEKMSEAAETVKAYLGRFASPQLLLMLGEWYALGGKTDELAGLAAKFPQPGKAAIVLGYYFEALGHWVAGDAAKMRASLSPIRSEVRTPLALYLALQLEIAGGEAGAIEQAYLELKRALPFLDFGERAKMDVKRWIAANFPSGKDLDDLARVSNLLLEGEMDDAELLRISLLHKLETRSLTRAEITRAVQLHPADKALKRIMSALPRMEADIAEAAGTK